MVDLSVQKEEQHLFQGGHSELVTTTQSTDLSVQMDLHNLLMGGH